MDLNKIQNLINECVTIEQVKYMGGGFSIDLLEVQKELYEAKLALSRITNNDDYFYGSDFQKHKIMKAYTMSARALTENGNHLKEIFLEKMVQEKKITNDQKIEMNDYCFVIAEKSFFGKIWDKIAPYLSHFCSLFYLTQLF